MKDGFERTLIIAKPEAVQSHNVGVIISRLEKVGLKLVGLKLIQADEDLVAKHYTADNLEWMKSVGAKQRKAYEARGETFPFDKDEDFGFTLIKMLRSHITESPVVAMVWEGPGAIKTCRKVAGATACSDAEPGSIRGDLSCDSYALGDKRGSPVRNFVHASDGIETAKQEIALWFKPEELFDWSDPFQKILFKV